MFKQRSCKPELLDTLELDFNLLTRNLREFAVINKWLGTNYVLKNALKKVSSAYIKMSAAQQQNKITMVDLGCGGGDLAKVIHRWAAYRQLNFEVTGVDINDDIVQFATQQSLGYTNLKFQSHDIFSAEFAEKNFDIACLNNVCHHFDDAKLIVLLKLLQQQTKAAIIINDLQRSPVAYYGFIVISKLFNLSYLAKHDGPLSVLRSFKRVELEQLMIAAAIKNFEIKWKWAFRWQIIIWCNKET
jgi:2-polyprenyl-3-methyl-5-hydroxy-6-metoxy-1,4-benzoquinol methylase